MYHLGKFLDVILQNFTHEFCFLFLSCIFCSWEYHDNVWLAKSLNEIYFLQYTTHKCCYLLSFVPACILSVLGKVGVGAFHESMSVVAMLNSFLSAIFNVCIGKWQPLLVCAKHCCYSSMGYRLNHLIEMFLILLLKYICMFFIFNYNLLQYFVTDIILQIAKRTQFLGKYQ